MKETIVADFPSTVLSSGAQTAVTNAAVTALSRPESIPALPRVITAVDGYLSKIPWWLLVGATASATWWILTRRAKKADA